MSGKKPPRRLPEQRQSVVPRPRTAPPAETGHPEESTAPETPPAAEERPRLAAVPPAPTRPVRPRPRPTEPRVLTVPAAGYPWSTAERRRRRRPLLLVALVVVVSLVTLGVVLLVHDPDGDAPSAEDSGPVPPSPVGLAPDTSYVATKVEPNGDLVVQHWIRSEVPVFGMTLAMPRPAGAGVVADGIRVYADGSQVSGPRSVNGQEAYYAALGGQELYIRYRLAGALERSTSATGRALARVTALQVGTRRPLTEVSRWITGAEVLSLACAPVGREAAPLPVPCGMPTSGGWQVDLDGTRVDDDVIAQLDLP